MTEQGRIPLPTRAAVTVAPLGDGTAACSLRPGGEAPRELRTRDCGTFADWSVRPADRPDAHGEMLACDRHLAAAARHQSERADARGDRPMTPQECNRRAAPLIGRRVTVNIRHARRDGPSFEETCAGRLLAIGRKVGAHRAQRPACLVIDATDDGGGVPIIVIRSVADISPADTENPEKT